jgi:large subunit ribosomal protein L4e
MCRKARMFAPLKVWRKWHYKANVTQRRHAVASALAASACTPLVMARGHKINGVPELPLVIDNLSLPNTKSLLAALQSFGAGEDLDKVRKSKHVRQGTGKYRHSRYVMRKGPLIIYGKDSDDVKRLAKNLPGVDTCSVYRLNVLQLAPGGHLGRFIIYTKDAFKALNNVFGTYKADSLEKKGYSLNRHVMACADIARIINSDQVQSKLRDVRQSVRAHDKNKKNPLTNKAIMNKLNPFAKKQAELVKKLDADRHAKKAALIKSKRSVAGKKEKLVRTKLYNSLQKDLKDSFTAAEKVIADEEKAGNYQPGDTTEEEEDDE